MKTFDKVLVKQAIANVTASPSYSAQFKRTVLRHAVETSANHAASRFGVCSNVVRRWLRLAGLESAINGYHWK